MIGWEMATHLRTELVLAALEMALYQVSTKGGQHQVGVSIRDCIGSLRSLFCPCGRGFDSRRLHHQHGDRDRFNSPALEIFPGRFIGKQIVVLILNTVRR